MSQAKQMLDTHPGDLNVDANLLARCLDACSECAQACTSCADSCLSESDVQAMTTCIGRDLICAEICETTARVVGRQTAYDADVTRRQLEACAAACKSCGDECAAHGEHMEHCRICAESCRRCEEACRELLAALS